MMLSPSRYNPPFHRHLFFHRKQFVANVYKYLENMNILRLRSRPHGIISGQPLPALPTWLEEMATPREKGLAVPSEPGIKSWPNMIL